MLQFLTKANKSECFSSDAGGPGRHLSDLLHALDPCALTHGLVQPGVPPVQVQDVAQRRVCRLLHGSWRNITHCNTCRHAQMLCKYEPLHIRTLYKPDSSGLRWSINADSQVTPDPIFSPFMDLTCICNISPFILTIYIPPSVSVFKHPTFLHYTQSTLYFWTKMFSAMRSSLEAKHTFIHSTLYLLWLFTISSIIQVSHRH